METAEDVGYKIKYDPQVEDFLQKLPESIRLRIKKRTQKAKSDPFHFFHHLEGRSEYKLRVGDYRLIADIDQSAKLISVLVIRHRKNVYKNL